MLKYLVDYFSFGFRYFPEFLFDVPKLIENPFIFVNLRYYIILHNHNISIFPTHF